MRICATSDLHGHLPEIPECDLLLLAGDIGPVWNHTPAYTRQWLASTFRDWLNRVPARRIVGTWGNHDLLAFSFPELIPELPWTCLVDEETEFEGLRIYGTPWQLTFNNWAFNLDALELAEKYKAIPDGIDIIVAHGPPYGFGDLAPAGNVGCQAFTWRIAEIKPKLVVYGHIHCDPGIGEWAGATLANVSLLNDDYQVAQKPWVFDIQTETNQGQQNVRLINKD